MSRSSLNNSRHFLFVNITTRLGKKKKGAKHVLEMREMIKMQKQVIMPRRQREQRGNSLGLEMNYTADLR